MKIRPLRINFRALAKMILCKTDAPMASFWGSPKANFLEIRSLRVNFRALAKIDFVQNRGSNGKLMGIAEGEFFEN